MRIRGFSVVEMMASMVISAMIFAALYQLTAQSLDLRDAAEEENRAQREMQFAFDRMVRTVSQSRRVLLPFDANPRDLFAVTLPESVDIDGNMFPDADNDFDGRIDEDPGNDITNDGMPGIEEIDDDNDGNVDENGFLSAGNDDERNGVESGEDPINGIDDDGDGWIDEDPPSDQNNDDEPGVENVDDDGDGSIDEGGFFRQNDDDEDGTDDEDWFDPVVYRLSGNTLIERMPMPFDVRGSSGVTGSDWVENVILENVQGFSARRDTTTKNDLITIELSITDANGVVHNLATTVRVGGAL